MGSIISAIYDDINEYESLCRKYGEEVRTSFDRYGIATPDCYSEHADELRKRRNEEWAETRTQQQP